MKKKIMLIVPMLHQGGFERICALTAKLLKDRQEVYLVIFSAEDMIYDVTGVNLSWGRSSICKSELRG